MTPHRHRFSFIKSLPPYVYPDTFSVRISGFTLRCQIIRNLTCKLRKLYTLCEASTPENWERLLFRSSLPRHPLKSDPHKWGKALSEGNQSNARGIPEVPTGSMGMVRHGATLQISGTTSL